MIGYQFFKILKFYKFQLFARQGLSKLHKSHFHWFGNYKFAQKCYFFSKLSILKPNRVEISASFCDFNKGYISKTVSPIFVA